MHERSKMLRALSLALSESSYVVSLSKVLHKYIYARSSTNANFIHWCLQWGDDDESQKRQFHWCNSLFHSVSALFGVWATEALWKVQPRKPKRCIYKHKKCKPMRLFSPLEIKLGFGLMKKREPQYWNHETTLLSEVLRTEKSCVTWPKIL